MRSIFSELKKRSNLLRKRLLFCDLCPRKCDVNRVKGEHGFCKAPAKLKISHNGLHFGEEPPISGSKGSGTIFFCHCNLHCVYCQNWQISQVDIQSSNYPSLSMSALQLARGMLDLQEQGALNINLVSPTHYVPQIVKALSIARKKGLKIPIVYNTNGYDSVEVLKLLDGIFDIYLPDIKYSDNQNALKYSAVANYVEVNRRAIREMYRQVGNLRFDKNGVAKKGILVRHLVLPNNIAGSRKSIRFLADIDPKIHISLMSQYHPCYKASKYHEINRFITQKEYEEVLEFARSLNLENIWAQDYESKDVLIPDFRKKKPFG